MAGATEEPLVSVIMSMRNASTTVLDTIRSLQWQTLNAWELVLFDDGSTDDSASVVQSISDKRIRLQRDSQRKGLATRLNEAVALARGRFIARIDADDICFPARLEKQVAYLESHPDIDIVASRAVVFSGRDLIGVMPVGSDHRTSSVSRSADSRFHTRPGAAARNGFVPTPTTDRSGRRRIRIC